MVVNLILAFVLFFFPIILFFLFIFLFFFLLSKKRDDGKYGELCVQQELNKLPSDVYKVINDVFIFVDGNYHQIDHVVVSPYGIFSIETKYWNGCITGGEYDKKWVRTFGKKTYYYTNPIRQNYGHVKSLSKILNIDESKIFNIVCISSDVGMKIDHKGELTRRFNIVNKILSYSDVVIYNVDEIVDIIKKNNIDDVKLKSEYFNSIKNNIDKIELNQCPKCGSELIMKNGKYGRFIGCSNYPHCKYTRKKFIIKL